MKRIISIVAIVAASLLAAVSCEKEKITIVESTGVTVSPSSLTMLVGEVKELSAAIAPDNTTSNLVKWSSSNNKVASVSQYGFVSGVGVGTATITATNGKIKGTCTVTVNPIKVTGVTVTPATAEAFDFSELTLTAKVEPSNATDKTVTWESSDKNLATVNKDGVVSTLAPGKVTITATTTDGSFKASAQITIKKSDNLNVWVNDDEGKAEIDGGDNAVTKDFLSYSKGIVTWPKNETGAIRKATIVFENGKSVTVTQIGPDDFKGEWNVTAKIFCQDNRFYKNPGAARVVSGIKAGKALLGETLKDGNGNEYTNQIGFDGFYDEGIILDACVDINYTAKTYRIGLFLDGRKAQWDPAIKKFVAFLPELCTTSSAGAFGSPWKFEAPDMGTPDYEWLWFEPEAGSFSKFVYSCQKVAQKHTFSGYASTPYICGISVVKFDKEEATAANQSGSYDTIYQFNYGKDNKEPDIVNVGIILEKK